MTYVNLTPTIVLLFRMLCHRLRERGLKGFVNPSAFLLPDSRQSQDSAFRARWSSELRPRNFVVTAGVGAGELQDLAELKEFHLES